MQLPMTFKEQHKPAMQHAWADASIATDGKKAEQPNKQTGTEQAGYSH